MKYYKLLYDYEHEDNSIFLEIDEKTLSFDRYEVEKGIEFCDWNVDIKVNYDNGNKRVITDYVPNDLSWFIVTDKLKSIIESMKNNKVQYLPIRARSKDESEVLDLYLVNICNIVDALDLENSKYSVHEIDENEKMISVQKYAIKGSMIKDIDIFRLKDHNMSIFISEKLKKAMEKNGITGCDYLEVKVV
jgi:hypothetical protein